ncbi:cyclophilin-like family protein [Haloarcula sp. GH36]|uniref:cyclophilin-like family protein n=1 Tax=Haloarcula montana TaxID=3111776 RepID=UPI002D7906C5|nr:cyclophilin-like family protein [Haloarcula sp. GH36]
MTDLRIAVDDHELTANWTGTNPTVRDAIASSLPIEGEATRWGEELYVRTDVDVTPEETQTEIPVGAVAYWPQGPVLCLFWGPTPASRDGEPRAASPVAVVARLDDVSPLERVAGDATLRFEAT